MNDDNKIISFQQKVAELRLRQAPEEDTEINYTPLPVPSTAEVDAFLRVLGYLRQIAPDQSGKVVFDPFSARVVLDANRLDYEDDMPQVNVGLAIEGVLPLVWHHLLNIDLEDDDQVSMEECAIVAHDIILQLDSDEEEPASE